MSEPDTEATEKEATEAGTAEPELPILDRPAEGLPPLVDTPEALARTVAALRAGTGPIALDAERAQGYRYTAAAYLIQLRREGSGSHLVDPRAFLVDGVPQLGELAEVLAEPEWILHAASQDLPCLTEAGLVPRALFDTELAGRLLHRDKVGLGPLIESVFGLRLLKEHSAADWSTRPLPADWLNYAALDVELLIPLREQMAAELEDAGKAGWAAEEFAALVAEAGVAKEPRKDPWRRTSGIHAITSRRGLAVVRELWQTRDGIARELDRGPGRVLADQAIIAIAGAKDPATLDLATLPSLRRRASRRYLTNWKQAVTRALALPERELPPQSAGGDGPPPPRVWASRDPLAAERLNRVRAETTAIAERHDLPVENLLTPDTLRRLAWRPPEPRDEAAVQGFLLEHGARGWQCELLVGALTPLLDDALSSAEVHEQQAVAGQRRRRRRGPTTT